MVTTLAIILIIGFVIYANKTDSVYRKSICEERGISEKFKFKQDF